MFCVLVDLTLGIVKAFFFVLETCICSLIKHGETTLSFCFFFSRTKQIWMVVKDEERQILNVHK